VIDTTQTPNTKVKIAAMNHLRSVAQLMQPGDSPTDMTVAEQVKCLFFQFNFDSL
jgi:hypothetical protein